MTARADGATRPFIERVLGPFERFAARESAGGIVLLLCTVVALAWANSPWAASYHHLWETPLTLGVGELVTRTTLHHVINDGLMAVFFFLVGLEIKRETLVGELASIRQSALPLAGALGGMLVPAAIYAALNFSGPGAPGWGIPMATDIAFALGVLALLGDRVPVALKVFLAALAIADDIGAVIVIAIFYATGVAWGALGAAAVMLVVAMAANRAGVRAPWVYALIGIGLWTAVLFSGVHATVAGVLLAFTIPSRTRIREAQFLADGRAALQEFDDALVDAPADAGLAAPAVLTNARSQDAMHHLERLVEQAQPPLHRLEHALHGIVAFGIMPLFALSNAGVTLPADISVAFASPITLGVILGLAVGKPIGITLFAWLAVRLNVAARPESVSWRQLHAVAWLGGIGFTMSLFVGGLAFAGAGSAGPAMLDSAKIGILVASLVAGTVGWLVMRRA